MEPVEPLKQRDVLLWIGSAIGMCVLVAWFIVQAHATMPHEGAVPKDWFQRELTVQEEWRKEHTSSIKKLNGDMNSLLLRLIEVVHTLKTQDKKHESPSE